MAVIDLSHTIRAGMVTYPGLPAPVLRDHMSRESSRAHYDAGTEFFIGAIDMVANTGTYMDAPFHRYPEGADMAGLDLARLVDVPGVVVDAGAERAIGPAAFDGVDLAGRAVLVRTGWSRHFGTEAYGSGHPFLTEAAVDVLVAAAPALVGIDSLNIDDNAGGARPAHSALLAAGIPIVEHMANLDRLPAGGFRLFAPPLAVRGMGSFPVRVFALTG